MKKVIAILLVLCVAASLFAAVTVKAGFDFGTTFAKTAEDKGVGKKDVKLQTHGVGFDVAVIGDVAPNLAVYGDVSAIFPIFFKSDYNGLDQTFTKDKDKATAWPDYPTVKDVYAEGLKVSSLALRAGVLYKMNVQGFDLGFGGGLVLSNTKMKIGDEKFDNYMRVVDRNFGLSLYATGTYAVAKNVGVNLTINPDVYLYNYSAVYKKYSPVTGDKEQCGFEAYGVKLGFGFNASVGVAFTF